MVEDLLKQLADLPQEKRELILNQLKKQSQLQQSTERAEANTPSAMQWPLSHMQLRIWMLENVEGSSSAYNMSTAIQIVGALNTSALEQALHWVIRRHDVLRSTVVVEQESPLQAIVCQDELLKLQTVLLDEKEYDTCLDTYPNLPFNEGPMFRYKLLQRSTDRYTLLLCFHHLVTDGWSIHIIAKELSIAYGAYVDGREPSLPKLEKQYADFVRYQLSEDVRRKQKKLIDYWYNELVGAPPLLELPLDYPRPAQWRSNGAEYRFAISSGMRTKLEYTARNHGITLYMLMLAAFKILLARYTNQLDIVVGSPVANRGEEWQHNIGMFVNTIALRSKIDTSDSLAAFLQKVKKCCLAAFSKQELPFELLVEKIQPTRTLSHAPILQNAFSLHDASDDDLNLKELVVSKMELPVQDVKFDLLLSLELKCNKINAKIEYNNDIYAQSSMQRFSNHYVNFLQEIVADCERTVLSYPLLSSEETEIVDKIWNGTTQELETGVLMHELFIGQVHKKPEATALIFLGRKVSYYELMLRAGQLSYLLRQEQVVPGELVAVICEKGIEQVVAVMGVLMSGAAYLPIETDWPLERITHLLKFGLVKQVVTQKKTVADLGLPSEFNYICLDSEKAVDKTAPYSVEVLQKPEDIAYVIFTSGSTGLPKGVVIQHQAVVNTLLDINRRYDVTEKDRVLAVSSLSFDLSVYDIFGVLAAGGTVIIPEDEHNKDPGYWLNLLEENQVSLWNTVPALMQMLCEYAETRDKRLTRSLRWCFMSGDWIPLDLPERIRSLAKNIDVHSGGGATEASIWSITYPIHSVKPEWSSIPYGRPLANQKFLILNDDLQYCPIGVTGHLCIGGVGVAHSYWRDSEKTQEKFFIEPRSGERFYKTGDLGRFGEDGVIEFMGRSDFQVKINGYRIELGEIESVIKTHCQLQDVLVVVKMDGDIRRIVAYIASQEQNSVNLREVRGKIYNILPNYMMPAAFVILNCFPLTANGKVDQKKLPDPVFSQDEPDFVAPRNEMEAELAQLYCCVLKVKRIGINQCFFDMGGHSLTAAQLVARAKNVFNVNLTVKDLFLYGAIAELSQRIKQLKDSGENKPIKQLTIQRTLQPASPAQYGLWLQTQLDISEKAYNMPAAIKLTGYLDITRLENAIHTIVKRHESLRTRFFEYQGELFQEVVEDIEFKLHHQNWVGQSDIDNEITGLAYDHAAESFDLEAGRLLRVTLIKLSDESHILLFCVHHICCDGWSFMVMLRELSVLYKNKNGGSILTELAYQYVDYSHWQRERLKNGEYERQLSYWEKELNGVERLKLPFDINNSQIDTTCGKTIPFCFSEKVSKEIFEESRKLGVTNYVLLMTSFKVLLGWYSRQTDITVGTTVAGRQAMELEPLIGYFANQLPIRTNLSGNPKFIVLVEKVRTKVLNALANQDIPYYQIAERIFERFGDKMPLFRAKFVYQNEMSAQIALPGLNAESIHVDNGSAKYDLLLIMEESSGMLKGTLQFREQCFSEDTIKIFINVWKNVLDSIGELKKYDITEIFNWLDRNSKSVSLENKEANIIGSRRKNIVSIEKSESI